MVAIGSEKYLVTSALPYVNNIPHLGNLVPVLSADVYHRHKKIQGYETIYICGTDESGTRTEIEAEKQGVSPEEYCKRMHDLQLRLFSWFRIGFTFYGRTSSEHNKRLTQEIFLDLYKGGYVFEKELELLYCPSCDRFLPDSFVEGECPYCGAPGAKGDQCDSCSRLLEAVELVNPRCKICGGTPVIKKDKHLFLDLPKLAPKVKEWIESNKHWDHAVRNLALAWIREGLEPRCITRNLKWGVPVPLEGYEDKVFYVWFDAPIGYIGITAEWSEAIGKPDEWERWWHSQDTRLVQFMGKDNLPFHTILWPASLIGSNEQRPPEKRWILAWNIGSNEYINYEGQKFSKSRGIGIFLDDVTNLDFDPDVWRYYVISMRSPHKDSDFDWDLFREKNNNELVANFGNFAYRALTFTRKYFDGRVPGAGLSDREKEAIREAEEYWQKSQKELDGLRLKEGLMLAMEIATLGNRLFQEGEPWKTIKTDPDQAARTIRACLEISRILALAMWPFTPGTSERLWRQLGMEGDITEKREIQPGRPIGMVEPLFRKIEKEEVARLRERFGGKSQKQVGEMVGFDEFKKIDLRVARVVSVEDHPNADRLYVLKIDLGGEERTIVAGLRGRVPKEELEGKKIVVVANLDPVNLRGVESRGMLLAADDGENLVVIGPMGDVKEGARVL